MSQRCLHTVAITFVVAAILVLPGLGARVETAVPGDSSSLQWPPTGYDYRRSPHKYNDGPVEVNTSIKLMGVHETNEGEGTAELAVVLMAMWVDTRLAYAGKFQLRPGEKFMPVKTGQIWTPDIGFRSLTLERQHLVEARVFPHGNVVLEKRLDIVVSSAFNLRWFPFDSQTVTFDAYVWAYSTDQVKLVAKENWKPWSQTAVTDPYSFASDYSSTKSHWNIRDFGGEVFETTGNAQGQKYSYIRLNLTMRRSALYYFFAYFVPVMIISLTASTSFFINFEDNGSRISVALSSILALIGMDYVLLADMPRAGYVFWVHIYLLGQFVLVMLPLIVHFIVAHYYRTGTDYDILSKEETEKRDSSCCNKIMWYAMWLLPSGYSSKKVARIDTIGYLIYLLLFFSFNGGMFLIAALFWMDNLDSSVL